MGDLNTSNINFQWNDELNKCSELKSSLLILRFSDVCADF